MADEQLAALAQHPLWPKLREKAEQAMTKEFDRIARQLMAGRTIEDADLAYRRGVFAGMKFLLDSPSLEATLLAQELNREGERRT